LEAREAMALADTYGGWALVTSRPVLPHALSHPINAFYPEIDHGVALAALTPEVMRFNIEKGDEETVSKYCQIAKAGGIKVDSFKGPIEANPVAVTGEDILNLYSKSM
jgi:alcohol dehydrogenase class IV